MVNSYIHSYHFDIYFSKKYDIIMLILKIFVSLNQTYLDYDNSQLDRISLFLTFVSNVIFYFYFIYIIYLLIH